MNVCLLGVLFVVRQRSLRGADHFTEESYGCLSVQSVVCCHVEACAKV